MSTHIVFLPNFHSAHPAHPARLVFIAISEVHEKSHSRLRIFFVDCTKSFDHRDPTRTMPLFLANLAMSSYFLALCYMFATVVTLTKYWEVRRVLRQHHHMGWSTVQLLVLSVALGCLFRTATFSTLCFFDSQSADLPPSSGGGFAGGNSHISNGGHESFKYGWLHDPEDANGSGDDGGNSKKELDFYNKVVAVLFNLPDFLFVSSYLLLVLVWAEAFQSV